MNKKKLFDYNLEVLQVSQLAAISVFDFIGKKDETAADKAAVESMRKELNKINFKGTIVIGEGERDKAPMLYIGEKVGNGNALEVDIALDPLEGTRITATNEKNALTALAVGDKNSFLHAPDVYMEKIAIGPNLPNTFLDLDKLKNWPDKVKTMQKNWIGKSEGMQFTFNLENEIEPISVFTTRPDTVMGVTFLAITTDHPIVSKLEKDFPVSKYVIRMYREVMMNMDFKYWTEKQKSTQLYHEYLNKNQEYSAVSSTC